MWDFPNFRWFDTEWPSTTYHWIIQHISYAPLFPSLEVVSHPTCLKLERISNGVDCWWLDVVQSPGSHFSLGVDVHSSRFKSVWGISYFYHIGTRWYIGNWKASIRPVKGSKICQLCEYCYWNCWVLQEPEYQWRKIHLGFLSYTLQCSLLLNSPQTKRSWWDSE